MKRLILKFLLLAALIAARPAGGLAQSNAAGTQGFAFDARGDVCEEMGKLGKNFRTFIGKYTQACSASTCPPQR